MEGLTKYMLFTSVAQIKDQFKNAISYLKFPILFYLSIHLLISFPYVDLFGGEH